MHSSPRPVEPAAPTSLSTYNPQPISGESPTRPGIFHANPEVVVTPEMSPLASTARQLLVPVGRSRKISSIRLLRATSSGESFTCEVLILPAGAVLCQLGPQLSCGFRLSRHASHFFRDSSVSKSCFLNPCLSAKRNAPPATSRMWSVRSSITLATLDGFLISCRLATAPARRVGPCITLASSSTSQSSFGNPP